MTPLFTSRQSGDKPVGWPGAMTKAGYAQTNLQLYAELRAAKYSAADIDCIRAAYELAMVLFTGRYRGSGKPFLAHLVGTASILATMHVRAPIVAAGLLHAAYTQGDFGNGWSGPSPEKRERLRVAVGAEVEDLIGRYTSLRWHTHTISEIHDGLEALAPREREVLLVRLANELEDHLDLGVLYGADAGRRRDHVGASLILCVDMAKRLGFPQLADALDQAFRETLSADVSMALRPGDGGSFIVAPASYRLRWPVRLRRLLAQLEWR
jgi:(p)ppGpp synthase/HD superfamily hydrolase